MNLALRFRSKPGIPIPKTKNSNPNKNLKLKMMKKADHKFHRDVKNKIDSQARQNQSIFYWNESNPIFIPKRKKKKN